MHEDTAIIILNGFIIGMLPYDYYMAIKSTNFICIYRSVKLLYISIHRSALFAGGLINLIANVEIT